MSLHRKWLAWTSLHNRPQMTLPNEFTQLPLNDLPKQLYMENNLPERVYTAALNQPA